MMVMPGALVTLLALAIISIFIGVIDLDIQRIFEPGEVHLLLVSRIPRTLATIITGGVLAVCGTIIQQLVHNRFVEPMSAGTGQGATLGILLSVLMFPEMPLLAQISFASVTAMLASAGLLFVVTKLPASQPLYVALAGMVYGSAISAGVTFFAYQYNLLQYLSIWMTGEFSGVLIGRYETLWIAALVALCAWRVADQFAIIGIGRNAAVGLGLNYNRLVLSGLAIISVVTALTVVTVGVVPFVGLVVPNIVSGLFGDNLRKTLPVVAVTGALLVLVCDIVGRLVRFPFEVPAGTLLGLVGAVLFLVILYWRTTRVW